LNIKTKKRKFNHSDKKDLEDLIVVGEMGERERLHQKKVQRLNELIEMRMERKKRTKELMAKRAGTFTET
jgi:hypothetical protein